MAAAVAFLGGAAFAVDKTYKHQICTDLHEATAPTARHTTDSANNSASPTDRAEYKRAADAMRFQARLLVFDGSLRRALLGLTDDTDRMAALESEVDTATPAQQDAIITQATADFQSFDAHIRAAQQACGQPQTGKLPTKTA